MLYHLDRYVESAEAATKAARADPLAAWPWEVKAQALSRIGRHREALDALSEARRLGDDEARLWWLVARCNAELGRPSDMLDALAKAIERAPQIAVPLDHPEAEPFRRYRHDPGFQNVYKPRPQAPKGPGDARLYGFL
jgi:tetratricopeptide (TPR) repeat protein